MIVRKSVPRGMNQECPNLRRILEIPRNPLRIDSARSEDGTVSKDAERTESPHPTNDTDRERATAENFSPLAPIPKHSPPTPVMLPQGAVRTFGMARTNE